MFEELRDIIIEKPKRHFGNIELPTTTLQQIYQDGWWITEIFGTDAVIVKKSNCVSRKGAPPYFMCLHQRININQLTPKALRVIEKIKKQQWNKYENLLKSKYG